MKQKSTSRKECPPTKVDQAAIRLKELKGDSDEKNAILQFLMSMDDRTMDSF